MSRRGLALVAAAVLLSAGLLGVQLARGGSDFIPQRAADPCKDRGRTAQPDLESLAELVVLTGVDEAACKLGVSRERLLLALLTQAEREQLAAEIGTDERAVVQALRDGLTAGVDRLDRTGRLPTTAQLLPSAAEQLGISQSLVQLIPPGLLSALPSTGDVLRRSLAKVDVDAVLAELENGGSIESIIRDAVVQGARDAVRDAIQNVLPGPLQGLLG